jgi:hypothetical protein
MHAALNTATTAAVIIIIIIIITLTITEVGHILKFLRLLQKLN